MTQEEKAKAYDDLLVKLQKAKVDNDVCDERYCCVIDDIVPELKESEDERLRKEIISALKFANVKGVYDKHLALLEKQWNKKPSDEVLKIRQEVYQSGYNDGYKHGIEDGKQGEKETPCDRCRKAQPNGSCQDITALGRCYVEGERKVKDTTVIYHESGLKALEKSLEKGCTEGEQKSADKVEPKFKVGDWVIFNENRNSAYQVEKIDNYHYYLRHYLGGTLSVHFDNELIREWNINDAKASDVLCTYECDEPKIVFILKGMPKKPYVLSYHCYYNIMYPHFETDSKKGCLAPNDEDVKPATKEQRDLLFKKMKEAGYEWDAEKFEPIKVPKTKEPEGALKKLLDEQDKFYKEAKIVLENKDTALAFLRRTGIIDEYGELAEKYRSDQTPATTISAVNGANSIAITDGNTSVTSKEVEKQYCTGKYEPDVREFPIEWKEENVDELSEFERAMMHIGGSFFGEKAGLDPNSTDDVKEQAELLLSLVPKQEWSEEDKDFMYETLSNLTELKDRYGEGHGNVGNCIDWLRSIKDKVQSLSQPKEWSEEDERMRQYVVNDLRFVKELVNDPNYAVSVEMVEKEIDWMESFKERYTWKPSDEQMKALHDLNLTGNISYAGQGQTLIELYNDLKKLMEE